eukprot:15506-Eustigmatos_ZCMA.PRE.1
MLELKRALDAKVRQATSSMLRCSCASRMWRYEVFALMLRLVISVLLGELSCDAHCSRRGLKQQTASSML